MFDSNATRTLHESMKSALSGAEDSVPKGLAKRWKSDVAHIHKAVVANARKMEAESERARIECAIMKEEMRDELLTREAISARTAERFRAINDAESEAGTGNAIDRAMRTATIIDTCIKQLSCHTLTVGQGTILLHEQSTQAFA